MVRVKSVPVVVCAFLAFATSSCSVVKEYPYEGLPWNHTPAWVNTMAEKVEQVPKQLPPAGSANASPTEYADPQSVRQGTPESLTSRVTPEALAASKSRPMEEAAEAMATAGALADVEAWGRGVLRRVPLEGQEFDAFASSLFDSSAFDSVDAEGNGVYEIYGRDPEHEPSPLERMYRGGLSKPRRALKQFGYDFFANVPENGPGGPVPANYEVLVGDEVVLTFSGSIKAMHTLNVQTDGTLAIPDIGNVRVAGRRFAELQQVITSYIEDVANRRAFRLSVSMGRLSEFQVTVVGEVEQPGLIGVPQGATVLTALALAGGPKRTGSLRRIEVRRGNRSVAAVDLYQFLTTGAEAGLTSLEPGDTIVVPTLGNTLGVAGYVLRPGIYESVGETSVGELLQLAGGLTPFSYRLHAQIETTQDGRRRAPVDLLLDDRGMATAMQDGELLTVASVDGVGKPVLEVVGEVVRPGTFEYREGMRVSDLLRLVDGLTVNAYLPQAFISRQVGAPANITIVPGRTSMRTTRRVLVVDLDKARSGDAEHDVLLRPLDTLTVQSRASAVPMPTIVIMGAVRAPGTYELTAGMRVSDLVALAGNVQPEVYFDEAELLRRTYDKEERGLRLQRYRFDLGKALQQTGSSHDPELSNGDQIVIRALRFAKVKVNVVGEVRFPGPYAFPAGAKISELIAAAGGVLPSADLRATVFTRVSVRQNQLARFRHLRERTQQLYEQALEKLVMGGHANEGLAAKLSLEQTREMLGRIGASQSTGRVVIPFVTEDFPGSVFDLTLEDGDHLVVKARQETVSVLGQVFNPGTFVAQPGVTVQDLLMRSGGVTGDGDSERLYVVRADGTVQGLDQGHYALRHSTRMLPGDVVLVPRRAPERTWQSELGDMLMMARQSAEVAFMMGRLINNDAELNFTSVSQGRQWSGLDESILNRGRK